ncbi:MAG: type VI secretion system tip protein VgrG [Psychromonas sp.]
MANSPSENSDGALKYSIFADNEQVVDTSILISFEVVYEVNKISTATLEYVDGDMAKADFLLSNEETFKPGTKLIIKAGYGTEESQIFSGIIIRHRIAIEGKVGSKLILECKSCAIAMTVSRHNCNFVKQKDSVIIKALLSNCVGVTADVTATTTTYEEMVQFNCTDWDFLLARAEANGFIVCIDDDKVSVKPPTSTSAILSVAYGKDLFDFTAEIDARYQFQTVKSVAWDSNTQKTVSESVASQQINEQGNLDAATLSDTLSLSEHRLQTTTPLEKGALKDWANAQQIKSALARIRGNMTFQGNAKAKIGTAINVLGVGDRFSGDVFVSAVTHQVNNGSWLTKVQFGMSPAWSAEYRDIVAPPASGLVPGVEGLQIGVVQKLDGDPHEQYRIQVSVPVLEAETKGIWARLATFYASSEFGNFFIPEVGDEVVLGYFNNNPCEPVILGSLYSSARKPAYAISAENEIKAIVTKNKLKIEFDEQKNAITIETPGENKIVLSDDGKYILLEDQNKNKVELSEAGIVLDSPKDIKISAKGKITIEAVGEVAMKSSTADAKVDGLNVTVTAQVGVTVKGSASAELSASGQTTVKGAIVMIN